jgi:ATP-dependent helicase Lhr and Lhr-like helicase
VREAPPEQTAVILAATDPAVPYGAMLPFPRREDGSRRALARAAGARVVLVNGEPALYLERGGRGVVTLPAFEDELVAAAAIEALIADATGSKRPFSIERIDGEPAATAPMSGAFVRAGFAPGYRGLTYRTPTREHAVAGRR